MACAVDTHAISTMGEERRKNMPRARPRSMTASVSSRSPAAFSLSSTTAATSASHCSSEDYTKYTSPFAPSKTNFRPVTYQTKEQLDNFFGTTQAQKRQQALRVRQQDGLVYWDIAEKDEWRFLLGALTPTTPNSHFRTAGNASPTTAIANANAGAGVKDYFGSFSPDISNSTSANGASGSTGTSWARRRSSAMTSLSCLSPLGLPSPGFCRGDIGDPFRSYGSSRRGSANPDFWNPIRSNSSSKSRPGSRGIDSSLDSPQNQVPPSPVVTVSGHREIQRRKRRSRSEVVRHNTVLDGPLPIPATSGAMGLFGNREGGIAAVTATVVADGGDTHTTLQREASNQAAAAATEMAQHGNDVDEVDEKDGIVASRSPTESLPQPLFRLSRLPLARRQANRELLDEAFTSPFSEPPQPSSSSQTPANANALIDVDPFNDSPMVDSDPTTSASQFQQQQRQESRSRQRRDTFGMLRPTASLDSAPVDGARFQDHSLEQNQMRDKQDEAIGNAPTTTCGNATQSDRQRQLRTVKSLTSLRASSNNRCGTDRSSDDDDDFQLTTPLNPRTGAKKYDSFLRQHHQGGDGGRSKAIDAASLRTSRSSVSLRHAVSNSTLSNSTVTKTSNPTNAHVKSASTSSTCPRTSVRRGTGLRTGIEVYDGISIPCASMYLYSDEEDNLTPADALGRPFRKKNKTKNKKYDTATGDANTSRRDFTAASIDLGSRNRNLTVHPPLSSSASSTTTSTSKVGKLLHRLVG